jgi:hypothetical protein
LRAQLEHVCESLPALWSELSNTQRKELLRSLIGRVILYREAPDRTAIKIVWISGHYSELYAKTPTICQRDVSRYDEMVERIGTLWQQGLSDAEIAARLREEGFHTARAAWVPPTSVRKIRKAHQWRGRRLHPNPDMIEGRLTVGGLARRLQVSPNWVYRRLYNGTIDPAYVEREARSQSYLIEDHPELMAQLQRQAPKTDPT